MLPAGAGRLSRPLRAALFFKDTEASHEQFYDEDAQKKRDRMSQVLSIPVSDFELSVRSRNCLQKMGVNTLGDLCRSTEAELLASKNFGETSLVEIKEMLVSKGLRLGQLATERQPIEVFEPESLSADEQALLAKPVSDLNLSVRARKCMIRLGINTHRRSGPPNGRRPAGVQELRRHQLERSPREAHHTRPEAAGRVAGRPTGFVSKTRRFVVALTTFLPFRADIARGTKTRNSFLRSNLRPKMPRAAPKMQLYFAQNRG